MEEAGCQAEFLVYNVTCLNWQLIYDSGSWYSFIIILSYFNCVFLVGFIIYPNLINKDVNTSQSNFDLKRPR